MWMENGTQLSCTLTYKKSIVNTRQSVVENVLCLMTDKYEAEYVASASLCSSCYYSMKISCVRQRVQILKLLSTSVTPVGMCVALMSLDVARWR